MFVYGATIAFASLGLFCDALLKGKSLYVLMVFAILLESLVLIIDSIVWYTLSTDYIYTPEWSFFIA